MEVFDFKAVPKSALNLHLITCNSFAIITDGRPIYRTLTNIYLIKVDTEAVAQRHATLRLSLNKCLNTKINKSSSSTSNTRSNIHNVVFFNSVNQLPTPVPPKNAILLHFTAVFG